MKRKTKTGRGGDDSAGRVETGQAPGKGVGGTSMESEG